MAFPLQGEYNSIVIKQRASKIESQALFSKLFSSALLPKLHSKNKTLISGLLAALFHHVTIFPSSLPTPPQLLLSSPNVSFHKDWFWTLLRCNWHITCVSFGLEWSPLFFEFLQLATWTSLTALCSFYYILWLSLQTLWFGSFSKWKALEGQNFGTISRPRGVTEGARERPGGNLFIYHFWLRLPSVTLAHLPFGIRTGYPITPRLVPSSVN